MTVRRLFSRRFLIVSVAVVGSCLPALADPPSSQPGQPSAPATESRAPIRLVLPIGPVKPLPRRRVPLPLGLKGESGVGIRLVTPIGPVRLRPDTKPLIDQGTRVAAPAKA